jgi:hypothetical protein
MEYTYYLANATLTLRVVEHLLANPRLPLLFMTVIHQIDGWVLRIKMAPTLATAAAEDLRAYMNELGVAYDPGMRVRMALWGLQIGQSPVEVMRRYQVAVVSHGKPDREDIEAFRRQFVMGLGYCPETLA